jgi:hypothetical protein
MPTKRKPIKRPIRQRVTLAAIKAYRAGDDAELRRLLALAPWEASPLEVDADEPCPYSPDKAIALSWPKAVALREELEKAASE